MFLHFIKGLLYSFRRAIKIQEKNNVPYNIMNGIRCMVYIIYIYVYMKKVLLRNIQRERTD